MTQALAAPKADSQLIEDLVGLVALVPEPPATDAQGAGRLEEDDGGAATARTSVRRRRWRRARRASARERANPPPMIKKVNFCNAAGAPPSSTSGIEASAVARTAGGRTLLDMNRYQWTVLFAAWLGWGFDVFDGLLFNYVAPNCVPTLLRLPIGSPAAKAATLYWSGILTSILLLGWAAGGILFGQIADRIGRTRTLLLTMLLYALGTAACAGARRTSGCWSLFRIVASLGIGGEWAAGAAMVAEVVPEKRRVEAGALLYTSAPAGLFLATFVNFEIAGVCFKGSPETSWRYVFLCGLIPAAVAFVVRLFVQRAGALEAGRARQRAARRASPSCSRPSTARSR